VGNKNTAASATARAFATGPDMQSGEGTMHGSTEPLPTGDADLPLDPARAVAITETLLGDRAAPDRLRAHVEDRLPLASSRWWRGFLDAWIRLSSDEQLAAAGSAWSSDARLAEQVMSRARALLGTERSLSVERALEVLFEDRAHLLSLLHRRWSQLQSPSAASTSLADAARLREVATPANVLATAWIGLLHTEAVDRAVAEVLADLLLERTGRWLDVIRDTLDGPASTATLSADLPSGWGNEHPALVGTVVFFAGLLADDPAVTDIRIIHEHDPEGDTWAAVLRFDAGGLEDTARDRILDRAGRVGGLAVQSDERGGVVVLA
jgi:hypothetical protein